MKITALIVAAGKGTRAGGTVAKQFTPLGDKVLLIHTIEAFDAFCDEIFVILPVGAMEYWAELSEKYKVKAEYSYFEGDSERFLSVKQGIRHISDDTDIVLVHDGVRPFVTSEVIERVIEAAKSNGAAVPVVPIADSLRRVDGGTVSRSEIMAVQTPQGFSYDIIRKAYKQQYNKAFTDDASVVEKLGYAIEMVEGDIRNFKITTPQDIEFAEYIFSKRKNTQDND